MAKKEDTKGIEIEGIKEYGQGLIDALKTWTSIKDIVSTIVDVDDKVRGLSKNLGITEERFGAIKIAITDSVVGITKMGGDLAAATKIQEDFMRAMGRSATLSSKLAEGLYAAQQALGQDATKIVTSFKDVGTSTKGAVEGMQTVMDVARRSGTNAEAVSSNVLNNMSAMNKFTFQGGVEGLAKMASQAVSLRTNMEYTLRLSEDLLQPERAIEMASAMQRLGVAQSDLLDPLRLMDLAQNDPTELQNQIVKMSEQFVMLNAKGNFEIMPGAKRQLMEIAAAMNIPYEQITKMALGSADLSKKMQEIKFPSSVANEETKTMIANLAEMDEKGEYKVSFFSKEEGREVTKGITELSEKDVEALREQSKDANKTLEDVAKEQLTLQKSMEASLLAIRNRTGLALAGGEMAKDLLGSVRRTTRVIPDALTVPQLGTKPIREVLDPGAQDFFKSLGNLAKGTGDINSVVGSLGKFEKEMQKFGSKAFEGTADSIVKSFNELSNSSSNFARMFTGGFEKVFGKAPKSTGGTQKTQTGDLEIKLLPEDSVHITQDQILAGTNLNNNGNSGMGKDTTHTVNLNINLTSDNPNIDTRQLMILMEKEEFKQGIYNAMTDVTKEGKIGLPENSYFS